MTTKEDLSIYIKDRFRVKEILDRICNYREIEKIDLHDNRDRGVFSFFFQYEDVQTIRIEEDTPKLQKERKINDDSSREYNRLRIENRIFTEHITIRVRSITIIELDNCVFEKGLSVESLEKRPLTVEVSCCIIHSGIALLRTNNYEMFNVSYSFVESISICDVKYREISIGFSEVPTISMEMCEIERFSTMGAHLNLILSNNSIIHNNSISMDSFDTYGVLGRLTTDMFLKILRKNIYINQINTYKKSMRECREKDKIESMKRYIKKMKKNNKKENQKRKQDARNYLLNFIILLNNSDDLRFEIEISSKLNYSYHKYKNKRFARVLLYPVGYFYRPSRIILTSITLIVLFGVIYQNIPGKMTGFKLFDSIYFSGITFFTIGYSDVFEEYTGLCAVIKDVLVLIEAGLGISLCSSLLASLVNKYIHK